MKNTSLGGVKPIQLAQILNFQTIPLLRVWLDELREKDLQEEGWLLSFLF
jgi:hypothetical protein